MSEEERYQKLANERQAALDQANQTYNDLINKNTEYSNSQKEFLTNYQNTQNDIYDRQTQFQVDLQNQNKERAEREYQKEAQASKNAYYDFINPYGVQAEIQAKNGLRNDGYSETVKSQAWTTQQNRTAQARAKMQDAKLQFDNAIKEAYLNNDTLKAELALKILEQQQQEALRSFNYVSETEQNRLNNNQGLDSDFNNRYNTLYNQIQEEKARQEAIRQWEKEMAFKEEQARIAQQQWEREFALSQQAMASSGGSGGSGGRSGGSSGSYSGGYDLTETTSTPQASGGNVFSNAINNALNAVNNAKISAKQSPSTFSSDKAKKWYLANIDGKTFTISQLKNLLTSGLDSNKLTSADVKRISKLYGV